jgi:AcrR family transcriptional regulator
MEEKELKIVQGASKIFMQYGIKSVNMDDMARHLGVSKKTLYQVVKDKEDLVRKAICAFGEIEDSQILSIVNKNLSAIDESFEIMQWVLSIFQNLHPSIMFDMEKYHPEVFCDMRDNRHKMIFECTVANMKKGQKEGVYRKDFNPEIIVRMYMAHVEAMFNPRLFPLGTFKLSEIYTTGYLYHLHGISSPKGYDLIKEKFKHIKNTH